MTASRYVRDSRDWRVESKSVAMLERDGYHVLRIAPSQRWNGKAKSTDLIRLVALKDREVRLISVGDRPLQTAERNRLRMLRRDLENCPTVEEWIWRELDRAPEVKPIR